MRSLILRHLTSTLARHQGGATAHDWWVATSLAVRDTIHERMIATQGEHAKHNVRRLYYLSMEYLMGRLFDCNLLATGLLDTARTALAGLDVKLEEIREAEIDMGLGNGGLGRLAACFLDSLSTHDYPALGYGIYYEFGLFKQEFVAGHQVEHPDRWRVFGSPWEVVHQDFSQTVQFYGRVKMFSTTAATHVRSGSKRRRSWACRMTSRLRATAPRRSICCACGRPTRPPTSISRHSTPAVTRRR